MPAGERSNAGGSFRRCRKRLDDGVGCAAASQRARLSAGAGCSSPGCLATLVILALACCDRTPRRRALTRAEATQPRRRRVRPTCRRLRCSVRRRSRRARRRANARRADAAYTSSTNFASGSRSSNDRNPHVAEPITHHLLRQRLAASGCARRPCRKRAVFRRDRRRPRPSCGARGEHHAAHFYRREPAEMHLCAILAAAVSQAAETRRPTPEDECMPSREHATAFGHLAKDVVENREIVRSEIPDDVGLLEETEIDARRLGIVDLAELAVDQTLRRIASTAPAYRKVWSVKSATPAVAAASTSIRARADRSSASGFSTSTCLPAAIALQSPWRGEGRAASRSRPNRPPDRSERRRDRRSRGSLG